MKKESLEEASERYAYGGREGSQRKAFIEGVKWMEKHLETFRCDGCGEEVDSSKKFPIVDENNNIQDGLFECLECRGL